MTPSVTRSLMEIFFKNIYLSQKLKRTKLLYLEIEPEVSEEKQQVFCFCFLDMWVTSFWLHLDEHGLHSSRKNTGECSSLYACHGEETKKYRRGEGKE